MIRARWLLPFAILISVQPQLAPAAEQSWHLLRAPNFTIVSHLDAKTTRGWAQEFHVFVSSLSDFWRVDSQHLAPLTFVLFRSKDAFARTGRRVPTGNRCASPRRSRAMARRS
jgi:hypothetical protein